MGPLLTAEAHAQLRLRHAIACDAARAYCDAGFSVVYQDIILGADLARVRERLADLRPLVIALVPDAATLLVRDSSRPKTGYSEGFPPEILVQAFAKELSRDVVRIDTSSMTVSEVVDRVLSL
ncbi:hypothetical protein K9B33_22280 [Sphingobium sp. 3R8]|uniref:hypothetical protein n=1 Tax=Sphingobium sp. 3R8 TaxID=2874921 RepID=UPI001CCC870F|nr:hypothetical protein [Sphingobium sp. 3R8]MBZ9650263.1 hypothetical protein [Sphingobium sp. 3R8]